MVKARTPDSFLRGSIQKFNSLLNGVQKDSRAGLSHGWGLQPLAKLSLSTSSQSKGSERGRMGQWEGAWFSRRVCPLSLPQHTSGKLPCPLKHRACESAPVTLKQHCIRNPCGNTEEQPRSPEAEVWIGLGAKLLLTTFCLGFSIIRHTPPPPRGKGEYDSLGKNVSSQHGRDGCFPRSAQEKYY